MTPDHDPAHLLVSAGILVAPERRDQWGPSHRDEAGVLWVRRPFPVPELDDLATGGVLLGRLDAAGMFAALNYGHNVDGQPVASIRAWPPDAPMLSRPTVSDDVTLGRAAARALLALLPVRP